ncbi:hypothetical protein ABEB36_009329 [Hypothenemus hampei]|uniref:DUF4817 domain-containing protein n=1 Tax=Hypothenemus hampei TaxID=57062 RepID=A0ABD1EG10_HYPHA
MPRHSLFSNAEMRDMVCVYAQENFVGRRAHRRYFELYPNRRQPDRGLFQNLFNRLGETGSFRPKRTVGRNNTISVDTEEEILIRVAENPEISTRQVARATRKMYCLLMKPRLHVEECSILEISTFGTLKILMLLLSVIFNKNLKLTFGAEL